MIASVRKNLALFISKHTPPVCSRSAISLSLSPNFFSSAAETHLDVSQLDVLMRKYDFPSELASKLTYLAKPENSHSVLSFFKETGFSNTQLIEIVKREPRCLASSVDSTLRPKIKFFKEYGFSSDDICKLVTRRPSILYLSLNNNVVPSLDVLLGLLGSKEEVDRVIIKCPRILASNLEKTVLQNIEFLKGFGIPINRICSVLCSYPSSFMAAAESVKKAAEKAKEMGLDTRSNSFIYAIPTLVSMTDGAWEAKLQAFRDLGFSDRDISTMFMKAPNVFCGSMKKIKPLLELLLATRRFDLSSVVNYPFSLQGSIEKRYKPWLRILGILESRGLIVDWPSLSKLKQLTDDEFSDEFIRPYPDVLINVEIITRFL